MAVAVFYARKERLVSFLSLLSCPSKHFNLLWGVFFDYRVPTILLINSPHRTTNFLQVVHQCNPPLRHDRSDINSATSLIHLANSSYTLDFPEVLNFQWSLYPISFLPITRPLPLRMKSWRYFSKRLLLQVAVKNHTGSEAATRWSQWLPLGR